MQITKQLSRFLGFNYVVGMQQINGHMDLKTVVGMRSHVLGKSL